MKKTLSILAMGTILFTGCTQQNTINKIPNETKLTLGTVQKNIKKGMTQSEVIKYLGSPNIVTRDKNEVETWVYDKMYTESYNSNTNTYGTLILIGVNNNESSSVSNQKTLTIVLKFKDNELTEYQYNRSSF